MSLTREEENFVKLSKIILDIVANHLRRFFKEKWDLKYPQNIWDDTTSVSGQFLLTQIRRKPNDTVKGHLKVGDTRYWDPTALFFVLLQSDLSIIDQCRPYKKRKIPLRDSEELDKLRVIRNIYFAHASSTSVSQGIYLQVIAGINLVCKAVNWHCALNEINTVDQSPIKTRLSDNLQKELAAQKKQNEEYNEYLIQLKERIGRTEKNVAGLKSRVIVVEEELHDVKKKVEDLGNHPETPKESDSDKSKIKNQYIKDYTHWTTPSITLEDGCFAISTKQHLREHVFVDLTLVKDSSENARIAEELSKFLERNRYAANNERITINEIVSTDSKIVFVRGVAGIGKTSLVEHIALSWAKEEDYLAKFEYVFLIKCREFDHTITDINAFFDDMYGIKLRDLRDKGESVLVILDGLDEVPELETVIEGNTILNKLIKCSGGPLPGHSTIITGRPHVESILKRHEEKITGKIRTVEVSGLSKDNIKLYVEKFSNGNDEIERKIKSYIENCPYVASLCTVPQYLNSLCCILGIERGDVEIEKKTSVYTWVFVSFIRQHLKSYNQEPYEILDDDLLAKFIHVLSEVSFKLLCQNKVIFHEGTFKAVDEIMESNYKLRDMLEVFIVKIKRSFGFYYQFRHLTLQEFFAASYCYINNEEVEELLDMSLFEVVTFMNGLYASENSKKETNIVSLFTKCLRKARCRGTTTVSGASAKLMGTTAVSVFNRTMRWIEHRKYLLRGSRPL